MQTDEVTLDAFRVVRKSLLTLFEENKNSTSITNNLGLPDSWIDDNEAQLDLLFEDSNAMPELIAKSLLAYEDPAEFLAAVILVNNAWLHKIKRMNTIPSGVMSIISLIERSKA